MNKYAAIQQTSVGIQLMKIHRKKSTIVNPICALMFNNSTTGSEFIFNGSKTSFGN